MTHPSLPSPARLRREIDTRFRSFLRSLPARLRRVVLEIVRRKAATRKLDTWAYFCPLSLPVAELPVWAGELARRQRKTLAPRFVLSAVESGMAGYLHARANDVLIDAAATPACQPLAVANAAWAWHVRAAAAIAGDRAGFWPYFEKHWQAHSAAMLVQQALREGELRADGRSFRAVLERSVPLVVPTAALLWAAGLQRYVAEFEALSAHLRFAAQMIDDIFDASEDASRGHATWFLARVGSPRGPTISYREMLINGALDRSLADINREFRAAIDLAEGLKLERASRYISTTRDQMAEIVQRVLGDWLCRSHSEPGQR